MSEQDIERDIRSKGLTAPRLTPEHLDSVITAEQYHVFPGTTMTVCCLTLANGFAVSGESSSVSPENFDEEIGRHVARERARDKIWALEGYLLRQRLHEAGTDPGEISDQAVIAAAVVHQPAVEKLTGQARTAETEQQVARDLLEAAKPHLRRLAR